MTWNAQSESWPMANGGQVEFWSIKLSVNVASGRLTFASANPPFGVPTIRLRAKDAFELHNMMIVLSAFLEEQEKESFPVYTAAWDK